MVNQNKTEIKTAFSPKYKLGGLTFKDEEIKIDLNISTVILQLYCKIKLIYFS